MLIPPRCRPIFLLLFITPTIVPCVASTERFSRAIECDVGPMPGRSVVADMNGDGRDDVVVACGTCCGSEPDEKSGHVVVLLSDGSGELIRAPGTPMKIASSARKVAVGDVDGDLDLDVVVAEHDSYVVTLLLNDGAGRLSYAAAASVTALRGDSPHTHDIQLVDVDGDSHLDIVTTNANDGNLSLLLGDGKAHFDPSPVSPIHAGWHPYDGIAIVDVNRDQRLDFVVPDLLGSGVRILVQTQDGEFIDAPGTPLHVGPRPIAVAVADLEKDGDVDLLVVHDDDPIAAVWLGSGDGTFAPSADGPLHLPFPCGSVRLGDVNGDEIVDALFGGMGSHGMFILLGDGTGDFTLPSARSGATLIASTGIGSPALIDLEGDGEADLISSSYSGGFLAIFRAVGPGLQPGSRAARCDVNEAWEKFSSRFEEESDDPLVWLTLSAAGRVDVEVARLDVAWREGNASVDELFTLGRLLQRGAESGHPSRDRSELARGADEVFRAVLELDPDHIGARFHKGETLARWPVRFGKREEAIDDARRLSEMLQRQSSINERTRARVAELLRRVGLHDDAKAIEAGSAAPSKT